VVKKSIIIFKSQRQQKNASFYALVYVILHFPFRRNSKSIFEKYKNGNNKILVAPILRFAFCTHRGDFSYTLSL